MRVVLRLVPILSSFGGVLRWKIPRTRGYAVTRFHGYAGNWGDIQERAGTKPNSKRRNASKKAIGRVGQVGLRSGLARLSRRRRLPKTLGPSPRSPERGVKRNSHGGLVDRTERSILHLFRQPLRPSPTPVRQTSGRPRAPRGVLNTSADLRSCVSRLSCCVIPDMATTTRR